MCCVLRYTYIKYNNNYSNNNNNNNNNNNKKRGKKHNYGIYNICCVLIKFYI